MNTHYQTTRKRKVFFIFTILLFALLSGCGSSSAILLTATPTSVPLSATPEPTETDTPAPQPTKTPTLTPTPEMPRIFPGVATEDAWIQVPAYSPEQAAQVIAYFQDPSRQPLKPDSKTKIGYLLSVGYNLGTEDFQMNLDVVGGKGLAPLASYMATGHRHVICEVIDIQNKVQIIDLAFFGGIPNQTKNISPETLNSSKRIFIDVLMTWKAPGNPDNEMKRDVEQIQQYLELVKQFQLPDFQGKPLPVIALWSDN